MGTPRARAGRNSNTIGTGALAAWNGAYRKTFNLGYAIDPAKGHFRLELKPETLQRIARLGASVMVSIYPAEASVRTD